MVALKNKQPALKPQDVVVTLKVAVNRDRRFTFVELSRELDISASEVHASAQRAEMSRLLRKEDGALVAVRTGLLEFLVHGVKYSFPPSIGSVTRGVATGVGAAPLRDMFAQGDNLFPVWPDSLGQDRGLSLLPLYPSVPYAARLDNRLYEMLALIDALRAGAAREREIAEMEINIRL